MKESYFVHHSFDLRVVIKIKVGVATVYFDTVDTKLTIKNSSFASH